MDGDGSMHHQPREVITRHGFRLMGVLVLVVTTGTVGYWYIENWSVFEAFYMTVITLSTVGYGEAWELTRAGKLWTIGVITFGIATASYAATSLVAVVVSGDLRSVRERNKMTASIKQLTDHVILCGYGRMGPFVVEELTRQDQRLIILEVRAELEPQLKNLKAPHLIGDATSEETLLEAGLMRAKALVTVLPHDADHVYITLTARTLNPGFIFGKQCAF